MLWQAAHKGLPREKLLKGGISSLKTNWKDETSQTCSRLLLYLDTGHGWHSLSSSIRPSKTKRKMKKTWTYKSYLFATHHSKIQCGKPKNEPPTLTYIAINQWHKPSKIRASWQDGHVDPPSLYPWPCFVSPAKTEGKDLENPRTLLESSN